ncbi:MAG: hypothetical protein ACRDD8_06275 [Bacteroidales bacterium]
MISRNTIKAFLSEKVINTGADLDQMGQFIRDNAELFEAPESGEVSLLSGVRIDTSGSNDPSNLRFEDFKNWAGSFIKQEQKDNAEDGNNDHFEILMKKILPLFMLMRAIAGDQECDCEDCRKRRESAGSPITRETSHIPEDLGIVSTSSGIHIPFAGGYYKNENGSGTVVRKEDIEQNQERVFISAEPSELVAGNFYICRLIEEHSQCLGNYFLYLGNKRSLSCSDMGHLEICTLKDNALNSCYQLIPESQVKQSV